MDPAHLIVCVLIRRFELRVALAGRGDLLGVPAAIAPEPGSRFVGAVSAAAEAYGIASGMRLGEVLARYPELALIPPDPAGVSDAFERVLSALESIGAAVEPLSPGLACFDARGLLGIHGGRDGDGVRCGYADGQSRLAEVLRAARRALGAPAHFGVAPTRFAALAAAGRARARRPLIVAGGRRQVREFLAPIPVTLLRRDPEFASLPEVLTRLGVNTLGELAALPRDAVADRFGRAGLAAQRLALGAYVPLRPREPSERLREALDLPEAAGAAQLERALDLLIGRLLARRERRGRTLRAAVLSAVLVERGGTWRQQVVFREATHDPLRIRLALAVRLDTLPAPAQTLILSATRFGPPAGEQQALLERPAHARVLRLREAIRQARSVAGPGAALRVVEIDPDSRLPERRSVLAPFEP